MGNIFISRKLDNFYQTKLNTNLTNNNLYNETSSIEASRGAIKENFTAIIMNHNRPINVKRLLNYIESNNLINENRQTSLYKCKNAKKIHGSQNILQNH